MNVLRYTLVFLICLLAIPTQAGAPQGSHSGKVAIITGSSSGVGYEMTQQAMARGMHLVLADINPAPSEQMAAAYRARGGRAIVVEVDLAIAAQRPAVIDRAVEEFGRIDYLFNNAGYAYVTSLANHDMAQAKRLFEVNYWAYVDLAQRAVPIMKQQKSGVIINISSYLGIAPASPLLGVYAASKHALMGFFQSVDAELEGTGVDIKLVSPAGMKTNIITNAVGQDAAKVQGGDQDWEPPAKVVKEIFEQLDDGELLQFPSVAKGYREQYLKSLMP